MNRPHIFVTADQIDGLRSVENIRRNIRSGHAKHLWESQLTLANSELNRKPYEPGDVFPGRDEMSARHANRDYTIVHRAGTRALRAALACLITEDRRYRDDALAQIYALFDTSRWPEWRDMAHRGMNIDLRAGQLSRSLSLAYDWLHPFLNASQRQGIVDGIDVCGIQPYLKDVANGVWWANGTNNWMTCVVGGHGIAGLALADDHPQSKALIDYAHPRLNSYFDNYGPEGEFNESVAYANAHALPLIYFSAHRYALSGGQNKLMDFPIADTCKWMMYFTVPPGHVVPFGDSQIGQPPSAPMFAAVADATRNRTLQWFYLEHSNPHNPDADPWELLWYDPTLEPQMPTIPRGKAYNSHSQNVSVRSTWDPKSATCVVYGKGGHGSEGHGNHDAGQVCIDSCGKRLITDPGSPPGYPADFFGENRYEYYNASVLGHNVLMFNQEEMLHQKSNSASIVASKFIDNKGGWWQINLTKLYSGANEVTRTVVYLAPNTVVVYDCASLKRNSEISLRWHTACDPNWSTDGRFGVLNSDAGIDCCVISPTNRKLTCNLHHHVYLAPYNRFRLGDEFEQVNEPYLEFLLSGDYAEFLTLFKVREKSSSPSEWEQRDDAWHNGDSVVRLATNRLEIVSQDAKWEVSV
ncbi:MAG: heparinase II/III family protein [Candidatus Latescibacterota bacterium]|nr:heparinase II/III family protein [Candidatus Latescibacterota bacterium]